MTCNGRTSGGEGKKVRWQATEKKAARHEPGIGASGRKAKAGESKREKSGDFQAAKPPPNSFVSPVCL
jgi:hypothetical protein